MIQPLLFTQQADPTNNLIADTDFILDLAAANTIRHDCARPQPLRNVR
jgi:hypothetical protein